MSVGYGRLFVQECGDYGRAGATAVPTVEVEFMSCRGTGEELREALSQGVRSDVLSGRRSVGGTLHGPEGMLVVLTDGEALHSSKGR